jgi:hypothetical protein
MTQRRQIRTAGQRIVHDGTGAGCHADTKAPVDGGVFLLTTPFIEPPRLRRFCRRGL